MTDRSKGLDAICCVLILVMRNKGSNQYRDFMKRKESILLIDYNLTLNIFFSLLFSLKPFTGISRRERDISIVGFGVVRERMVGCERGRITGLTNLLSN